MNSVFLCFSPTDLKGVTRELRVIQSQQEAMQSEQEAQLEELLELMSNLNSSIKASPPKSACKWWHSDNLCVYLATYVTKAYFQTSPTCAMGVCRHYLTKCTDVVV